MSKQARQAAVRAAVSRGTGSKTTPGEDGASAAATSDPLLESVAAPTAQDVRQAQQDAAAGIDNLPRYPLSKVAPHPFNPAARLDVDEELVDLGENIKEHGLQQPIVLAERHLVERDDPAAGRLLPEAAEWVLIAGHRRYGGARNAGVSELPGLLRTGKCTPEIIAGIFNDENNRRKAPSPLMMAETYRRMQEAKMSTTQIGQRVGVSQSHVSRTLKLLPLSDWTEAAREMHAGRLTRDDALALLDLPDASRADVFSAWQAEQNSGEGSALRVHARRHARAHRPDEERAKRSTTSGSAPATSTSTEGVDTMGSTASDKGGGASSHERDLTDIVAAVVEAEPSATVRGDIITDAALYVDESSLKSVPWRPTAEQVLGERLPKRGAMEDGLPQKSRRTLALVRAVALLEASAARCSQENPPPHIERHQARLRELGVL